MNQSFMDEALSLAERGRGWVSPNPMVGAVVVRDGAVVGRGWHQKFGGPHAEVFALQEAGEKAKGATLYCTLEPCNHTGKTPPCAKAVIAAGISRVVLGARDPNPVAAGGVEALRAAGIEVVTGVRAAECQLLNAAFIKFVRTQLPFVSLKWAMSADGRIATASGDSKWITGEPAREFAHQLRGRHDAVLAGIGTVLKDGARLNCRAAKTSVHQPRRVVLDSLASLPTDAPLLKVEGAGPVTLFCNAQAPRDRVSALTAAGVEVVTLNGPRGALPVDGVLKDLGKRGVLSVFVEGGSRVLGSFFDARHCDMAYVFIAPLLVGGEESIGAVGGTGSARIADGLHMRDLQVRQFGSDVLLSGVMGEWPWLASQTPA